MNILEEIIRTKHKELKLRKSILDPDLLLKKIEDLPAGPSFVEALTQADASGVIAEYKTQSPSSGIINPEANIEKISLGYVEAGASCLSVLTDNKYFGGSFDNLTRVRKVHACPILQKDFIIDEYQIAEAKLYRANAILLIAAVHKGSRLLELASFARQCGLEVIMEIHAAEEIDLINEYVDIIGVNNRNLKTFRTDIQQSLELIAQLPEGIPKISESGIDSAEKLILLKRAGYRGFLIGEHFMKETDPAAACADLVNRIHILESK